MFKTKAMKNILLYSLFLLPLLMLSCKKEAVNNPENAIKVTAQVSSDGTLKTAFTAPTSVTWIAATDKFGLYSDRAYTGTLGNAATNVNYTAVSTGATSTFSSATTVYWDGTLNVHNFYAYYPYTASAPAKTAVPISLPAAQTQSAATTNHIGALDFEVATPLALTPVPGNNPLVAFTFNHLFTILKFDITCNNNNTLTSISLTKTSAPNVSLNTGSTIDITQATPAAGVPYTLSAAGGGTPLNVTLTANLPITTTPASAYMLILPGNHTGTNNFTIGFTNGSAKTYNLPKNGINFERGKVYTITVDIPTTGAGHW
jgi:hypothetical protein